MCSAQPPIRPQRPGGCPGNGVEGAAALVGTHQQVLWPPPARGAAAGWPGPLPPGPGFREEQRPPPGTAGPRPPGTAERVVGPLPDPLKQKLKIAPAGDDLLQADRQGHQERSAGWARSGLDARAQSGIGSQGEAQQGHVRACNGPRPISARSLGVLGLLGPKGEIAGAVPGPPKIQQQDCRSVGLRLARDKAHGAPAALALGIAGQHHNNAGGLVVDPCHQPARRDTPSEAVSEISCRASMDWGVAGTGASGRKGWGPSKQMPRR